MGTPWCRSRRVVITRFQRHFGAMGTTAPATKSPITSSFNATSVRWGLCGNRAGATEYAVSTPLRCDGDASATSSSSSGSVFQRHFGAMGTTASAGPDRTIQRFNATSVRWGRSRRCHYRKGLACFNATSVRWGHEVIEHLAMARFVSTPLRCDGDPRYPCAHH